eukprot:TRINITY_DN37833_c0_g1_i1.p1 TRINITY_DN37833_c0_g1~~TRINITY_DN37833_c0_g1_i1.p1  ORF type:complete len:780 (-),score=165.94 TRINITY_DN37833_c0_g1_i1:320-2602(-)
MHFQHLPGISHFQDEHSHAELRIILESSFNAQKDWIDKRLHQHEQAIADLISKETKGSGTVPAKSESEASDVGCRPSSSSAHTALALAGPEKEMADGLSSHSTDTPLGPGPIALGLASSTLSKVMMAGPIAPDAMLLPGQIPAPDLAQLHQAAILESAEEHDEVHELVARLEEMFDQLDLDGSGTLNRKELRNAFMQVGIPDIPAVKAIIESSSNMEIDRLEWLHMIEDASRDDTEAFVIFAKKLIGAQSDKGSLVDAPKCPTYKCYIKHDGKFRMIWDMAMMLCLFYVSLSMPFAMGFGQVQVLQDIDRTCDVLFLVDVAINFRTTFIDRDEIVVTNGKKMAVNYLKTWFCLDFVSSMPWDAVTAGLLPSLQAARLLKVGKIAKVFKLLRLGKVIKSLASSEFLEMLEDQFSPKASQTAGRLINLVVVTMVVCHWLACCLAAFDNGVFEKYFGDTSASSDDKYVAALYWAVTTLTTVGYGDIIPTSTEERGYSMVAMMIGSSFYGYIIGCITSVITDMDIDKRTFNERMEVIQAWLDFHDRMPAILRRRIRRHFKEQYRNRTIADDATIVSDLSGMLRADTAYFIIHEKVRTTPVFRGMPGSALASLVCVLKKTAAKAEENIVIAGDPGTAMYVIIDGAAWVSQGHRWVPPEIAQLHSPHVLSKDLHEGDSFGEEVIFSLEQTYQYTVTAKNAVALYELSMDSFRYQFRNMPELFQKMLANFLKGRKHLVVRGREIRSKLSLISADEVGPPALPMEGFQ